MRKTKLQMFKERWADGCGNDMCDAALTRVFLRGKVPADVVFVGEAPGPTENVHGIPFIGQAGRVMDDIIAMSLPEDVRWVLTNTVCCYPEDEGGKFRQPDLDEALQCGGRLKEFLELCRPRLVVAVGKVSHELLDRTALHKVRVPDSVRYQVSIEHPGSILRMPLQFRQLEVQKSAAKVSEAWERARQ